MPLHIPILIPKRFWVPAHRHFDTRGGYQVGPYVLHGSEISGDRGSIFFILPPDYKSMTKINVHMRPWTTNANWPLEIVARAGGVGEDWFAIPYETQAITIAATDNVLLRLDLVPILTTIIPQLEAGDMFHVTIENKLLAAWITCFGADVRYS